MFNLKSKTIVVVGGNGHIGKEICKCLINKNANVISLDSSFLKNY